MGDWVVVAGVWSWLKWAELAQCLLIKSNSTTVVGESVVELGKHALVIVWVVESAHLLKMLLLTFLFGRSTEAMHVLSRDVSGSRSRVWPCGVDGNASSSCANASHLFYFLAKKHLQLLGLIIAVARLGPAAGATSFSCWPVVSCSRISVAQCTTRLRHTLFLAPPSLRARVILQESLAFLKVRHSIAAFWSPLDLFGIALHAVSSADSPRALPSRRPRSRISDWVISIANLKRIGLLLPHLPNRYFIWNIKGLDPIRLALRCHIHRPAIRWLLLLRIKHIIMLLRLMHSVQTLMRHLLPIIRALLCDLLVIANVIPCVPQLLVLLLLLLLLAKFGFQLVLVL